MSKNKIVVPSAREELDPFKMEAANEVGVNLKTATTATLLQDRQVQSAVKWLIR